MASARILIVEDEEAAAESVQHVLEMYGYAPLGVASSGEEAIARAGIIRPDLVLMDVGLHGALDGVETAAALRERFGLPVVYLTAHADEATLERAKRTEPLGYVLKPFEPRELRTVVEMALLRSELERKLRASEARYHGVLQDMTDLVCRFSLDGRLSFANEACKCQLGIGADELPGALLAALEAETERGTVAGRLQKLTLEQAALAFEQETTLADGRVVWLQWTVRAIFDGTGAISELQAVGRDISQRVEAERALQRARAELERRVEERAAELVEVNEHLRREVAERQRTGEELVAYTALLEHLLHSSPAVIYARRPEAEMELTYVGQNVEAQLGYRPEKLTAEPDFFARLVHPDDLLPVHSGLHALQEHGYQIQEFRLLHNDGRYRWLRDESRLVRDAAGEPIEVVGTCIDITERVEAEAVVARHARAMTALYETLLELNSQPDLATLLHSIVQQALTMLGVEMGWLFLVTPDGQALELVVGAQLPARLLGTRLAFGEGQAGRVAASGEILAVEHYSEWPGRSAKWEGLEIGRALGVPLKVDRRVIGALMVGNRERVGGFEQEDIRLLGLFADQAAVAVERGRLLQAERGQRELAEALANAAMAVNSTLNLDEVLDRILEQVERVVAGDTFNILLIEKGQARLVRHRGYQRLGAMHLLPEDAMTVAEYPILQRMVQTGRPVLLQDTTDSKEWVLPEGQEWRRSYVAAPIRVGEQVVGFLNVNGVQAMQFGPADGERLMAFASHAAVAIENARLYEQARKDAETRRVLLREVNHRVKNNLAAIIGLLYAERRHTQIRDDSIYQAIMQDLVNRVQGLSTVHGMLSATEWSPLPLTELVERVIQSSLQMLPRDRQVLVVVDRSNIRVPAEQAHNLALVINELATNTIKHGLAGRVEGSIRVGIRQEGDEVSLEYSDDGPGYGAEILADVSSSQHVGFGVVRNIVHKSLAGRLELENRDGAVAHIRFPLARGRD